MTKFNLFEKIGSKYYNVKRGHGYHIGHTCAKGLLKFKHFKVFDRQQKLIGADCLGITRFVVLFSIILVVISLSLCVKFLTTRVSGIFYVKHWSRYFKSNWNNFFYRSIVIFSIFRGKMKFRFVENYNGIIKEKFNRNT